MEKEKLARIMVFIVIVGLVGAYLPVLFTPQPQENIPQVPTTDESASLAPAISGNNKEAASPSELEPKPESTTSPDGFGGLEEEKNSLKDLETMLQE